MVQAHQPDESVLAVPGVPTYLDPRDDPRNKGS